MKNIQLVGKIRYLIFALVAIQAIIILMMTTFRLGEWYDENGTRYKIRLISISFI